MERRDAGVVLGFPVNLKPIDVLVEEATSAVEHKRPALVFACANPHSIVTAQDDPKFREALLFADHLVVDGSGISLMARLMNIRVGPRITGTDYYFALMRALVRRGGGRVCFFGSSNNVLDSIRRRFVRDFPQLDLCCAISPPYGQWGNDENAQMVAKINAARPDVLWVGMTAPKQEKWVQENRHLLNVPVIGSIGAVFDFYAGTYPRAPDWMCKYGIEWLYRFMKEPKRMWRRNCVSAPRFVALMIRQHVLDARH